MSLHTNMLHKYKTEAPGITQLVHKMLTNYGNIRDWASSRISPTLTVNFARSITSFTINTSPQQ